MKLFEPLELAPNLSLPNRLVMAPMTRNRADEGNVPTDLMVEYYRQRAGFGLQVTEATTISQTAHGYPDTPGIYTAEQIAGWKKVSDAVHEAGGHIFCQLWHCGRISHPSYQKNGKFPFSASPIAAKGVKIHKRDGTPVTKLVKPREMTLDDIDFTVADYRQAAKNAREAGFDGVEIHGANGYLIEQFLANGSNKRKDEYGGSVENRARFLFEILDAVATEWPERTAVRLSPAGTFNDIEDTNREALHSHVVERLNEYDLAYLHIVEPRMFEEHDITTYDLPLSTKTWRPLFKGILISSGGHLRDSGNILLNHAQADLIAYGRPALANPDLPRRFEQGANLNEPDYDTFYGGDEKGYTDYPTLEEAAANPVETMPVDGEQVPANEALEPEPEPVANDPEPLEAKPDEPTPVEPASDPSDNEPAPSAEKPEKQKTPDPDNPITADEVREMLE
jgi:N-ethylmaleimide reductase